MEHTMTVTEILDALYDGIGCSWVEEGKYPNDIETLGMLTKRICFENSKEYFGL